MGQQDAPRKRRHPSQSSGLWNGGLIKTDNENVFVSTSQSKWDKGKTFVFNMIKQYLDHEAKGSLLEPIFDFKTLEKGRGFLVHLSGTYPNIKPRLKGLHHTLDGWRGHRDSDGWKLNDLDLNISLSEGRRNTDGDTSEFLLPKQSHNGSVTAVKRLRDDLIALGNLFKCIEPPLRLVRGKRIFIVKYGFGDASGSGFGSSWLDQEGKISYRYGTWGTDESSQSSNFRVS